MRVPLPKVVRVHYGPSYGGYPYLVASVFEMAPRKDGEYIYRNTGASTPPSRSREDTERLAQGLAAEHGAVYLPGFGSLHHQPVITREAPARHALAQ